VTFTQFVIVTGLSGAGKSQAMKSFEDLGFYCLDNLPPALVVDFVTLLERAGISRVALSLDVRVHGPFGEAVTALGELRTRGVAFDVLFLDASDDTLVRRYSETRRRHPSADSAAPTLGLAEAIARERIELESLRAGATRVWDTSSLTQSTLKSRIITTYAADAPTACMAVRVVAFGFKFGLPLDADLLFDVRFFRNPNYDPDLKALTGADPAVENFMEALAETEPFLGHLFGTIDYLLPLYVAEGKARLTIAIGCTGGRHRSVYIARRLAAHIEPQQRVTLTCEFRELVTA
jgi:UPF0042 nucleotide-binding protein